MFVVLLLAFSAAAQVRTGVVADSDGITLPGVTVVVTSTRQGTTTDLDGKYSITAGASDTLQFSFIGFETKLEAVGARSKIDVVLSFKSEQLDELVVTALGIPRSEKSLGYSVGEMDTKDATTNRDPNVVNSMQGKIAGVDITKTSGGPGASSSILIRGNSSIVNNNQPLVVVDGIPIDNTTVGTGGTWGGIDYGSPISDINPDDIESLVVLKGPSAAALYGSRALNGVIVITTKSGSKDGKKWTVSLNSTSSVESPYIQKDFQNEYGAGSDGEFKLNSDGVPFFDTDRPSTPTYASSWGPKMEGQTYIDWDSTETTFSPQENNYREYFQTGYTLTNNVSVSRGGKVPIRVSYTNLKNRGISPTSTFGRHNLNVNANGNITKKLSFNVKGSLVQQQAFNRVNQSNGHNAARNIIMMPRNVSTASMQNFENAGGEEQVWYRGWGWIGNPFYTLNRNINEDERNRALGNAALTYKVNDWLHVMARYGTDAFEEQRHNRFAYGSFIVPRGQFTDQTIRFQETNADWLVTANRKVKEHLEITVNAGGNAMHQKRTTDELSVAQLIEPDIYTAENGVAGSVNQRTWLWEKKINAVYGSTQIAWKNWLFLELTGRNDWSSTLPNANNSYFYPSASLSYVFTDHREWFNPKVFSFGKVRLSAAEVGKDADPYLLELLYDTLVSVDGVQLSSVHNPFPLVNLQPEKKRSYEIGTDLRFFENRIGMDFTYYTETTRNQVLTSSVSAASGFTTAIVNAGEIRNRGVEVLFTAKPIDKKHFKWNTIINYTTNNNLVVSLNSQGQREVLGNQWRIDVTATPGLPYGALWGYDIQRDANGAALLNGDGSYLRTDEQVYLGHINPDWKGGWTNQFEYKNWSVSFLVDVKKGGKVYSATNMYLHGYAGNVEATLEGREGWYASEAEREAQGIAAPTYDNGNYVSSWDATGGYQVEGVYADGTMINGEDVSGQAATRYINPQNYWSQYASWTNEIHTPFVYDASYVKLREVSVSWAAPEAFYKKMKMNSFALSLSARNLWLIYSAVPNVDPEASYTNGNGKGVEYATYPILRSIGLNLKATF